MKLVIYHAVPSLNRLFAMNPWQRRKEKLETQAKFLAALESQAIVAGCSTSTISRADANTFAIAARTLALYRGMQQIKSRSKSLKSKLEQRKQNAPN